MRYWAANALQRLLLILVPLLAIAIPALKTIPSLLNFKNKNRLYRRYEILLKMERDLSARQLNDNEIKLATAQLDSIESDIGSTKFPLDFADRIYTLRQHVNYVRAQLRKEKKDSFSMKIMITGGAGFLGVRLASTLLAMGSLSVNGQAAAPITRITLADRVPPPDDLVADPRIEVALGDLNTQLSATPNLIAARADTAVVYHLAAAVSGECEADFNLGMRSNFAATHRLLEACRATKLQPMVVFASSLAVFGQTALLTLPELVTDTTLPTPQSSYGI